jgi:glycosyltransferase involved in cell wall biosynthesis
MIEDRPDLSIIISTWNSLKYLKECISSIIRLNIPNLEVIIVDSNSTDGTLEYLSSVKNKLNLTVRRCLFKATWSQANQTGLDITRGEWICLSNPDIIFNDSFLKMFEQCRTSDILVAAPQLVYPDGRLQRPARTFTPWLSLCAHTRIVRLLLRIAGKPTPSFLFPYEPDKKEAVPVDSPQGSLFMFHRKVLEMFNGHLWNEGYLNGVSDFDAFLNLKRKRIPIWLFPQYRMIHYGSYVSKKYPSWIERDQAYGLVLYFRYWSKAKPKIPGNFSPALYSILFGLEGVVAVGFDIAGKTFKRNPFFNPRLSAWRAGQRLMGLLDGWKFPIASQPEP